ncbi:MAG: hypothetical protein ACI4XM_08785 [Candidatus Coprovivens sp.]
MKKLVQILFYLFYLFLILTPIWPKMEEFTIFFFIAFIIIDLLILWKCDKSKIKIDIVDILIILLPLSYFVPYILHKNVFPFQSAVFSIFNELLFTITIIILRRFITKNRINEIIMVMLTASTIYFFISFLYLVLPKRMMLLGIFSYFGDTYLNSIDRFYGTLDYCNASALLFVISIFIACFKLSSDKNNRIIYLFLLFVNGLGFLFTFSKMLSIAFLIVSFVLLLYLYLSKKKQMFSIIISSLFAFILPGLLMVSFYRNFLINLNFLVFITLLLICFVIFCILQKTFYLVYKWKNIIFYSFSLLFLCFIIYFSCYPVSIPLYVRNVVLDNEFILSDFILENDSYYEITIDMSSYSNSNVNFSLCKLYLSSLYPREEIIETIDLGEPLRFSFWAQDDAEYYYIKVSNIDSSTSLKINSLQINGNDYLINSLFVPYAFVHQIDLIKYDKESVSHRIWYYQDSLKILKKNGFIVGQGVNTFKYYSLLDRSRYLELDPHSYLFQLWLDVGVYGVIYIFLLAVIGIYYMWKNRKRYYIIPWFCIFSVCMIVLPFDIIFSLLFFKVLLVLSFILVIDLTNKLIQ